VVVTGLLKGTEIAITKGDCRQCQGDDYRDKTDRFKMYLIDSCSWLEWFTNGELADDYRKYLKKEDQLLVPTIVLYQRQKVFNPINYYHILSY